MLTWLSKDFAKQLLMNKNDDINNCIPSVCISDGYTKTTFTFSFRYDAENTIHGLSFSGARLIFFELKRNCEHITGRGGSSVLYTLIYVDHLIREESRGLHDIREFMDRLD